MRSDKLSSANSDPILDNLLSMSFELGMVLLSKFNDALQYSVLIPKNLTYLINNLK